MSILDIRLYFTSGYHPEADGQTERTNQTLEQYLRIYCNYQQSDWAQQLPLAEFTYNNTPSSTTNISPFFANKGYHPRLDIQPNRSPYPASPLSDAACYYSSNLEKIHTQLKHSIANAQTRYKKSADNRRSLAPEINVGDHVFVLAKFIKTTRPSKKLSEKFLGPFKVSDRLGLHSYHVKLLDSNLEFEVAQILDSKLDKRRRDPLLYYVQWSGYENTVDENSWLTAADLKNATELVADFHRRYPNKP